jgi:hypothetical protein
MVFIDNELMTENLERGFLIYMSKLLLYLKSVLSESKPTWIQHLPSKEEIERLIGESEGREDRFKTIREKVYKIFDEKQKENKVFIEDNGIYSEHLLSEISLSFNRKVGILISKTEELRPIYKKEGDRFIFNGYKKMNNIGVK